VQALLQHTPSTQKPLPHWSAEVQAEAVDSLVWQAPALQ
jgi:hypothetical protein